MKGAEPVVSLSTSPRGMWLISNAAMVSRHCALALLSAAFDCLWPSLLLANVSFVSLSISVTCSRAVCPYTTHTRRDITHTAHIIQRLHNGCQATPGQPACHPLRTPPSTRTHQ